MAQYVTLQGKQFKAENGNDFYPLICNYQVGLAVVNGNYFFTPNTSYGTPFSNDECGNNSPDCPSRIQADFHEIKKMGFNCVRLMGAQVLKDHFAWPSLIHGIPAALTTNNSTNQFAISIRTVLPAPSTLYPNYDILFFTSPYNTDANLQNYFTALDDILTRANAEGLKVILVTSGGRYALSDTYAPLSGSSGSTIRDQNAHDYADMLAAFGIHFKNNTTLMAYDLWNEPATWSEGVSYVKIKQDVCTWTKSWFETLKDNTCDPHHLITIGTQNFYDLNQWDPGIMKLDFLSIHLYPDSWDGDGLDDPTGSNSTSLTNSYNRYKNNLVWISKNAPLPWIVGETGFERDVSGGSLWGTETEQATFALNSLNDAKSAGCSGYAWWQFQDIGYETYGLLNPVDPSTTYDATTCFCYPYATSAERQAATVFQSYLYTYGQTVSPITIAAAPNYFNPFLHPANPVDNTGTPSTVSNTYNDQSGNHLVDAVVSASTPLFNDITQQGNPLIYDGHYTFTDGNGNFTLLPYDYDPNPPNTNKIEDYRITGVGVDVDERGWGGTFNPYYYPVVSGLTIPLWKAPGFFDIDEVVNGITVANGTQNFEGFETLSAGNLDIQPSASSELKARQEINVHSEFHASMGSEVHIYTTETFPDCGMFWGYRSPVTNSTTSNNNQDSNQAEIDLQFKKKASAFGFTIQPNPNNGIFTINIVEQNNEEQNVEITVFDLMGRKVYSKTVTATLYNMDFSNIAKGIYYVQLKNNEKRITKKLIIQ